MAEWLSQNIGTIVVLLIIVAIVAAIIINTVKNHKKGKSFCGGSCANCPMSGSCHTKSN